MITWKETLDTCRFLCSVLGCTALVVSTGCQQAPLADELKAAAEYRLDSGDHIQIDIHDQRDLSGRFVVDTSGRVSLLKAGAIELRGATLREAEKRIAEQLKLELRRPIVSVNIVEYRPVFVTGEVRTPGKYAFANALTVLKAVALAGGYGPRASSRHLVIVREDGTRLPALESSLLRPGDTVDVGEGLF
jgi:protein involved in polysaccharide export with SLBB domain